MGNYKKDNMLEKHFTPAHLIDEMLALADRFYGNDNIIEYLENSAGNGAIIDKLTKPYIAYDIFNETKRDDIKECNYLKEKIEYLPGRVAIINPPWNKGLKFVYKALKECDYVIALLSMNSLINLDYDKIYADEIQLYRNMDFGSCKASCIIVALRKKRDGDTYN